MSASASKKRRQQLNEQGLTTKQLAQAKEKKERSKKLIPTLIFCAVAVLAVAAIVILAVISGKQKERMLDEQYADHIGASTTVLATVGEETFTAAMYNYFFSYYSSYNGKELDGANHELSETLNFYAEAKNNNYTLTEEDRAAVDEQVEQMKTTAASYNYPKLDYFLHDAYGEGCNEQNFREYATIMQTVSSYQAKLREDYTPSAEEINAEYTANVDDYDIVSYDVYTVKAPEADAEDEAAAAEEPDAEALEQLAAEAKAAFPEEKADNRYGSKNNVTSSFNEEVAAWLFDSARKAGDTEVFETVSDETTTYSVIRFNEYNKNDYNPVIGSITYFFNTAEVAEGEQTTEEKIQEIISKTTPDMSEEDYKELIGEAGYYNAPTELAKYTLGKDATNFLYGESRAAGDLQYFDMGSGSMFCLVRYQSVSESSYLETMIKNKLLNEMFEEIGHKNEIQINEEAYALTNLDAELYNPTEAE